MKWRTPEEVRLIQEEGRKKRDERQRQGLAEMKAVHLREKGILLRSKFNTLDGKAKMDALHAGWIVADD